MRWVTLEGARLLSDASSDKLHFRTLTHGSVGWCHQYQDCHHHQQHRCFLCGLWFNVFLQNSSSAINTIVCHRQTVVISHWIYSPSECHHPMACHHHHQVKCQVCNAMNRTSNDITLAHSTDNYTAWSVHLMTQIPCWQSSSSSTPMNLGIFSHSERLSKV